MNVRVARPDDAAALHAIHAPIVADTIVSFELEVPSVDTMRDRIASTLGHLPWLVSEDDAGAIDGYVHASRHRERLADQWSVDVTAYVRANARGRGIGKRLYGRLFDELAALGYFQAFAGIALPNAASMALHESVGFVHLGTYRDVGFKRDAWHDVGWWQRRLQASRPPTPPLPFTNR